MSSTLDVISGGRLELGLGAGGGGGDHRASGYPFPSTATRVEMLEEAAELIKLLWTQSDASFQGRHYTLEGAVNEPKPVQRPHPPILIGGHGETHLLRAVARFGDICNIGFEMSVEEHQAKLELLNAHCQAVGRNLGDIVVTHNTRVVIAKNRRDFRRLVQQGASESNVSIIDYEKSLGRAVAGTPEECVEQIRGYVESGIKYFLLLFPDPILNEDLELFAGEVMPHFV